MAYIRKYSLDLAQSKGYVSPYQGRPTPFEAGSGFVQAESEAAGGSQFSHHRAFRGSVYAKDCLPTENGYVSVAYKKICNDAWTPDVCDHAEFLIDCNGDKETLFTYSRNKITGIAPHVTGSLIQETGTARTLQVEKIINECRVRITDVEFKALEMFKNEILGLTTVEGHTIVWNKKELYYNGGEHFFDFTPMLRTGAGQTSLLSDIGAFVQIIPNGKGMYIFGHRGAVYGDCTGDVQFPFRFSKVLDFNGITHEDDVRSDLHSSNILVMSHNVLQLVSGLQASSIFPDESYAFLRGTVGSIYYRNQPDLEIARGGGEGHKDEDINLPHHKETGDHDPYEFQDEYVEECDFEMFSERTLVGCEEQHVAVNNLDDRYSTVSYGSTTHGKTINDRSDRGTYSYSRLFVWDKLLQRYTVLHIDHTDVIRGRHEGREPFIIVDCCDTYCVTTEEGTAELFFNELQRSSGSAITLSRIQVTGEFKRDEYRENREIYSILPFSLGIDDAHTVTVEDMQMTGYDSREVSYAGLIRNRVLSFVLPFSGFINELTLDVA